MGHKMYNTNLHLSLFMLDTENFQLLDSNMWPMF